MSGERINYDRVAGIYDITSRIVFLGKQQRIQRQVIRFIRSWDRVLIAGGGSGWILEDDYIQSLKGVDIDFVDNSARMLRLASGRRLGPLNVQFRQENIFDFMSSGQYDVIFTSFLFDNFEAEECRALFDRLDGLLKHGGRWLNCDFSINNRYGAWWKKTILSLMHHFFNCMAGVSTRSLTDDINLFEGGGYVLEYEEYLYLHFLSGKVFSKVKEAKGIQGEP